MAAATVVLLLVLQRFGLEGRALSLPLCCERLYPTLPTALASYQAWRASPNNDARWCDHWSIGS